jgi:hypothetical protein
MCVQGREVRETMVHDLVFGFLPVSLCAIVKGSALAAHPPRSLLCCHVAFGHGGLLLCLLQGDSPSSVEHCRPAQWRDPRIYVRLHVAILSEERINITKATGVGLVFFGVPLIAHPWSGSGEVDIAGVAYMVAGSLSVGCSFVYVAH